MHALRQEILPPSGVEFAASLKLTPATITDGVFSSPSTPTASGNVISRASYNIVVARSNVLRIFEVREVPAPISAQLDDERERRSTVRRGTEAVEGEVMMDQQGEGFVNMGSLKPTGPSGTAYPPTVIRFYFIREHRLHGTVTGLEGIRIVSSLEDKLDRLLVSFKDAKIALLEWSDTIHGLVTVSIHTYERAPQLLSLDSSLFRAELRTDPLSRCAALSLPKDALAILPFYQTQAELDVMEQDKSRARDVPYSPSFVLDLATDVDERIRNVVDFVFLPGFNSPTIAVLFQPQQTWTGRLKEFKDTMNLFIFTLDLVTRTNPVITAVEGLPYDCVSLLPCSPALGGVVVLTVNSLIHVDQASRRVVLPVNGWPPRVSDMPMPALSPEEQLRDLQLEGSRLAFVDERTLFVILRDGTIYPVEFFVDGKVVSKLVMAPALAQTTIPTIVKVTGEHLFVGSTVGPSALLKTTNVEEVVLGDTEGNDASSSPTAVVDMGNAMDVDDDDDIYGSSQINPQPIVNGTSSDAVSIAKKRNVIHLSLCDSLPGYGPISDMTFSLARNGDRPMPELVAATGAGYLGGFTLFQRDLPIRTKRKLHAIGGARGVWSLPVRQAVKVNGVSYERPTNPFHSDNDSVIISTDANPSPGLSRIATRSAKNDITITTRIPGTTIGAAPFFHGTAILHVLTNAIRVLEPDGSERQIIKDMDGNNYRPKIKSCSICDPFVLILREDDSIGLFIVAEGGSKIRRKDMSPMGEKVFFFFFFFFFHITGLFQPHANNNNPGGDNANQTTTSTLHSAMNAGQKSQWLILCRPQGVMEIWSLPKLSLVFSTTAVASLQGLLVDSYDPPALSLPQDPPRKPQELDIDQILIAPLGESSPRPHLFVFLRSGQLAIYETVPSEPRFDSPPPSRTQLLAVKFVKVLSRAFDIQHFEEPEKSVLAEQKRISRSLIPFVTSPSPEVNFSGVFFTGDRPCWVLCTDKGGIRLHPSGHAVVHSFTSCSLWESKGDFLLYSEEGPSLLEWMPNLQLDMDLPCRHVPRGRPYTNILFDPSTCLIIAASSLQARFTSFDEEGNQIWEPDAANVSYPMSDCSTLELLTPDGWITMDGYEFAPNEFVNAVDCVTLETQSTDTGHKNYIAVGTTVNRGEDLAVKGATYIFEIVEVVPDPASGLKRSFKLRLRCRDDAKGPVTALCGIDGYLVSSMGQKVFVRAFDLDERLVGVAFLDVGVYVTSLRSLKNLIIISDAVKSMWFVAFQEDPYKLAILAKDPHQLCVTSADFFFADQQLSIVGCDEEGVVRMYEYDPHDPESKNGQHLLRRTEFHGQVEYRTSLTVARRTKGEDMATPQAKLICGSPDGSLTALIPVDEETFKRLYLLQGQLTRNVQHTAGLNPKAFRMVRNDYVSKPLSKGILDGNLLGSFEELPITRQNEITRQIGTERNSVLRDWSSMVGPPGSGKSTYCYGKHQLFSALNRPISIVNLDPANDNIPYPCAVDLSSLITLQDVMDEHGLGPNGGILYCMEYLEANYDWLEEQLNQLGKDAYVLFDLPGQVELSTNHHSLKRIVQKLTKSGFRLAAVHLCDAHYVTDASKYVSVLLLSLRTMLHLELPHINVLSKVDLITQFGDLDFNLDFYTEVQDLSYLENALTSTSPRYASLNMAICGLIEDFGLVSFETLAVEVRKASTLLDKHSMLHLTRAIDRATGYVFVPPPTSSAPKGTTNDPDAPSSERPNTYALFSSAAGQMLGERSNIRDVQERWIEAREEWDAYEKVQWRKEGELVRREAESAARRVSRPRCDASIITCYVKGRSRGRDTSTSTSFYSNYILHIAAMKLKEIHRTSTFAWSPLPSIPLLATGTVAGALDESFSNESQLEIWAPDFLNRQEYDLGGEGQPGPKGVVTDSARFNRIAWGYADGSRPQGIIVAGMENGELGIWDPEKIVAHVPSSESLILKNSTHTGPIRGLDFNPIQTSLFSSGGTNGEARSFAFLSHGDVLTINLITDLYLGPQRSKQTLLSRNTTGYTVVWDLRGKREVVALAYGGGAGTLAGGGLQGSGMSFGGRRGMSDVAWHPDNATKLVTSSEDDTSPVIMVWDLRNARAPEKILTGHERGILSLSWCKQDADLLLSSGKDNRALCWNPETSEIIGELPSAENWAFQVQWCPRNPDLLATACFDGTIGIHSIQSTNTSTSGELPAVTPKPDATLSLKQPPKWLRRPVSSSFGYGGQLVSVSNLPSAQGRHQSGVVHLRKIVTEESVIDRANKLRVAIDAQNLSALAAERSSEAATKAEESAESWKALLSLFQTNSRDELVTLLGFSKSEIAARVADAVENLKAAATADNTTVITPAEDNNMETKPHEPVVSFAEPEHSPSELGEDPLESAGSALEATPSELSASAASDTTNATPLADGESTTTAPSLFGDEHAPGTPQTDAAADFFSTMGISQTTADEVQVVPHTNYGLDSSVAATIGSGPSSVASDTLKGNTFTIYTADESDTDCLITKALVVGDFESAVSLCLVTDRYADAILLAASGGPELLARTQKEYFLRQTTTLPYLRLFQSIVTNDLSDIVQNVDLQEWQECFVVLCTFASAEEFPSLVEQLGARLEFQGSIKKSTDPDSPDKARTFRKNATLTYLAAGRLERLVNIWMEELVEEEKRILENETQAGVSRYTAHAHALQTFIEKVTVFRAAIHYVDEDVDAKSQSNDPNIKVYRLAALYDRYFEYADFLATQGLIKDAVTFLKLTPAQYEGQSGSRVDFAVGRERILVAGGAKAPAVTTSAAPTVPLAPELQPTSSLPTSGPGYGYPRYGASVQQQQPALAGGPVTTSYPSYAPVPLSTTPSAYAPLNSAPTTQAYAPSIAAGGYGYVQQQPAVVPSMVPPPPHATGSVPAPAPPPKRRENGGWNDAPAIADRRTPSLMNLNKPSAITSPFPNAPSPTILPSPAYIGRGQSPTIIPPPRPGSVQSRAPPPQGHRMQPPQQAAQGPYPPQARPPSGPPGPPQRVMSPGQQIPPHQPPQPQYAAPPHRGHVVPPPGAGHALGGALPPGPYARATPPPGAGGMAPPPQQGFSRAGPLPSGPGQFNGPPGFAPPPPHSAPQAIPPAGPGPPPPPLPQSMTRGPQPLGAASNPTPAAPRAPVGPKYPPGDRSHIPDSLRPSFNVVLEHMTRLRQTTPPQQKRLVDDLERRINPLFDAMNCETLSQPVVDRLVVLAKAMENHDRETALAIHVDMLTSVGDDIALWMSGVKQLIMRLLGLMFYLRRTMFLYLCVRVPSSSVAKLSELNDGGFEAGSSATHPRSSYTKSTVISVYGDTWAEFYTWELVECRRTITAIAGTRTTPKSLPIYELADGDKAYADSRQTCVTSPTTLQVTNYRDVGSFQSISEILCDGLPIYDEMEPYPSYDACAPAIQLVAFPAKTRLNVLEFIPFADAGFPYQEAAAKFAGMAWQSHFYDPDLEIIQFEALRRLHFGHTLSIDEIDQESVLRISQGLLRDVLQRDMLSWPASTNIDVLSFPPLHVQLQPLERDLHERLTHASANFCSCLNCITYSCSRHSDPKAPYHPVRAQVKANGLRLRDDVPTIMCRKPCYEVYFQRCQLIPDEAVFEITDEEETPPYHLIFGHLSMNFI
ncbi:hypothetical protein EW146_g1016 [Bondarzewia mesenterica]|uniref:Protein transport protein SEC31 n=1 Tax=Bondarzewia mesenterica TaxID=1095465 RepID=A0A4S4M7D4_9AGAM|nr:hypothetical protein EW146_g1016 [Bondarzewia mesenterica]